MNHLPLLSLFSIALLLCGCCIAPPTPLSDKIPADLEIAYSTGACHAEWGRTNIDIDASGAGVYESGSGMYENNRFQNEDFRKTFRLNESELLGLLNDIEGSGFYSLSDQYSDLNVMDGSCEYISVTKGNATKSASVSNTIAPEAYSKAASAISAMAESKTR